MTDVEPLLVRATSSKGRGVFAACRWYAGDLVISARVIASIPERTTHSFQTAIDTHCEFDEPARLLNHSCDPNLGIRDNEFGAFDFIALRSIAGDEELTWDYATSEYQSIAVPECHCGATACRRTIPGYLYLTPIERSRLTHIAGYLADY
ncbi:SET domain-containing protein-lysine N-methyltransferase [Nocardia sp. CA-128927]|uniref:SET domain-containing protein-lysine N-methyltransferase n=1 Tax=Nocardia sp. CA-128927 TaxID=3239975 RepID=UPI003D994A80